MVDFRIFCISMKAVWAGRLLNCIEGTWGIIPKKYFEQTRIEKILCMNAENKKHVPTKIPESYKEVVESWYLSGGGSKAPNIANDIRAQFLWGNRYIQSKRKMLYFKTWKESNINFEDDLLDPNGKFISGEENFNKLKMHQIRL